MVPLEFKTGKPHMSHNAQVTHLTIQHLSAQPHFAKLTAKLAPESRLCEEITVLKLASKSSHQHCSTQARVLSALYIV